MSEPKNETQNPFTRFDPDEIARLVVRDLKDQIVDLGVRENAPPVDDKQLSIAATLVQVGARGLIPPEQREGVPNPILDPKDRTKVRIFPGEPEALPRQQQLYFDLYQSGKPASDEQLAASLGAIRYGAEILKNLGFDAAANGVETYLREQRIQPVLPQKPQSAADPEGTAPK